MGGKRRTSKSETAEQEDSSGGENNTGSVKRPGSRDVRRDLVAIALYAVTLFLCVSTMTYDSADPISDPIWPVGLFFQPDITSFPQNEQIQNACGYWGALVSSLLIHGVGLGAALVVAAVGGIATALLFRGRMNAPVLRSLGGTILLVATCTGLGLLTWQPSGFPVVGTGGYLGAMTSTWLGSHFAAAGSWILVGTAACVGLLMTTDYALFYAGKKVLDTGKAASRPMMRSVGALRGRVRRPMQGNDIEALRAAADAHRSADRMEPTEPPLEIENGEEPDDSSEQGKAEEDPPIKIRTPKKKSRSTEDITTDNKDEESQAVEDVVSEMDEEEGYEDVEEEEESVHRELETEDNEVLQLRQDPPHEDREIRVRQARRNKERDLRAEVFSDVREDLPGTAREYHLPPLELLKESDDVSYDEQLTEVRRKAKMIEQAFQSFGFNIRVVEIETGPVIAQYEVELESGLRLSKINGLADDLAIALRVPSVRIVAPIPGKNTVGIEVPNDTRQVVRLRDVIEETDESAQKMNVPIFLGKDVSGNPMTVDLAKMPHLLIAGRTGTGKSVCLNAIISSILMTRRPDEVRMLMIDPKMVELSGYGRLPHLMHPVITDMKKAEAILAWAVEKMEERYSLLARVGVRHINGYNDLGQDELMRRLEVDPDDDPQIQEKLPFIVIVADEMADLMMTAGKDVEQHIIRLAQKSRAVGIHLILATQKPTVDVITGLIKSNLPARLSFQVASRTDSRVVLDENGADKLLGNGDMLFLWPGTSVLLRGQGTYLSDDEIDRVTDHCSTGEQHFVGELMNLKVADEEGEGSPSDIEAIRKKDELYESAIEVVVREQRGSISLIQRCLGIGYGRAARLIDYMAEDGIVGQYNGSKSREILIDMPQWQRMQGLDPDDPDNEEGVQDQAASSAVSSGSSEGALGIEDFDDDQYEDA